MCTIWYPADPSGLAQLPGAYTDTAVETDPNWFLFWSWPLQWTNVMAHCVTHTFRDVPLATGTNRFPLILHSHGWTMDRTFNSEDAAELASHGYIVAAVDHEDCHVTVFPDVRGASYQVLPPSIDSTILIPNRVKDLEILLNELEGMDQDDALLAGRLDLSRIGVMGLSYGGGTAAELARADARVKCAALLEPAIWSENYPALFSQGVKKPFVLINTPLFTHTDISPSPSEFRDMSQTLYNLATTNATWFYIAGVGHVGGLSDFAWTVEQTTASRPGALAINASLVWFFDTNLKGESPTFPTNSPITNLVRK
jgi:pimeloyl-ACP methyl ester carboxylesterase